MSSENEKLQDTVDALNAALDTIQYHYELLYNKAYVMQEALRETNDVVRNAEMLNADTLVERNDEILKSATLVDRGTGEN